MADQGLTEFCTITFKDSATPPTTWAEITSELQEVAGVSGLYFGSKTESPATWVLVIQWTSGAAFKAFTHSEGFKPWFAKYQSVVEKDSMHQVPLGPKAGVALGAPCTEIFTAFGIESTFPENMGSFVKAMDAASPEGYHGIGWGIVEEEIAAPTGKKGPAALMAVGWDSEDAHMRVKGSPGNRKYSRSGIRRSWRCLTSLFSDYGEHTSLASG